ncbi:hypothetical protein [Adhaeribacter aquaticus]|uniref:hypothetical protein n=1 Tax=Adhaeribacter aquaticus TaxID=299567 RepID=UPI0004276500|nr:hypothetical protein [Adhaeribacter aquaticus]
MDITQEEFGEKFQETVDTLILAMAEHEEVNMEKFYSMACVLENLAFFSPVIYGAITKAKSKEI